MTTAVIHPTAIVSETAVIGEGTVVGPYSIIGEKVIIGKNNKISPHVIIEGNTKIGDSNTFFQFSSIGAQPQDLKYRGEESVLTIGSNNIVREYVTIQPGTLGGGMKTVVGDKNLFMANSHAGHDAIIGNNNIFANSSALAGHVIVGNNVTVGGLCGIHQFVKLGDFSLLGAGSMVTLDIPPYCIAQGDRAKLVGINKIGLERAGYKKEEIAEIQRLFRDIFYGEGVLKEKIRSLADKHAGTKVLLSLINFIQSSERGVSGIRKRDEL